MALPRLPTWLATVGGPPAAVTCAVYTQSVPDLERVYGREETRAILSNCAHQVWFPPRDADTARAVSELLGERLRAGGLRLPERPGAGRRAGRPRRPQRGQRRRQPLRAPPPGAHPRPGPRPPRGDGGLPQPGACASSPRTARTALVAAPSSRLPGPPPRPPRRRPPRRRGAGRRRRTGVGGPGRRAPVGGAPRASWTTPGGGPGGGAGRATEAHPDGAPPAPAGAPAVADGRRRRPALPARRRRRRRTPAAYW